ncbi:Lrp/AsnC ligand binding domain-containing protein [Spongisporangium articulatum]|uniref:Lrp/AsnC ligand binding domain-containing protein n=1 Tax=Spongisporangium articulatum TaxID=3362603 RepID=A0ABW8AJ36_9ACTN
MVTAFVLLEVAPDRIPETAAEAATVAGVREVHSVTGDVDLIAVVQVGAHDELAEVITNHLSKVPGVRGTRTYLAFRQYSGTELETAFDLGLDGD